MQLIISMTKFSDNASDGGGYPQQKQLEKYKTTK